MLFFLRRVQWVGLFPSGCPVMTLFSRFGELGGQGIVPEGGRAFCGAIRVTEDQMRASFREI